MRTPDSNQPRRLSARTRIHAAALPLALIGTHAIAAQSTPDASPEASPVSNGILPTETVAILTGPEPAMNETHERFMVYGTDLGSTFMHDDEIVLVFGDTFGYNKGAWRSNVIGFSTDDAPSDGVTIDRMIVDEHSAAKEVLESKKVDFDEMTVIPTYGISLGDRMVLHYMSVSHWGEPGHWDLGHAGFAYSDDGGETWTKDEATLLPGDTNFGQVAMEEYEGHIYIWGIPGGRYGGVQLARAEMQSLLDLTAWEYWDGTGWIAEVDGAAEVVPPNVGELSVRWNSYYQRWIMMYLNDPAGLIELRTADEITGPWSDPLIVTTAFDYPALYAPYQYPLWNDGADIYFNMSLFGPYQVYLLKTRIPELAP